LGTTLFLIIGGSLFFDFFLEIDNLEFYERMERASSSSDEEAIEDDS